MWSFHYSPATEFGRGITKEVLWYVTGPSTGDVTTGATPPVEPVPSWASPDTTGSSEVMGVQDGWALRPLSALTPAPPSFAHSRLEPQRSSFSLELVTVAAGWRERERERWRWMRCGGRGEILMGRTQEERTTQKDKTKHHRKENRN